MKKSWRPIVMTAATALSGAGLIFVAPASAASAASATTTATTAHVVRTSTSAMATTNDKVDALAYANGVVYAAGLFTRMTFKGPVTSAAISARSAPPPERRPRSARTSTGR
jgi:hypothetical protein